MRLIYPKDKSKWDPNQMPFVPCSMTISRSSGWLLVAAAQDGYDAYVCMLREDRTEISIEKSSKLLGKAHVNFEDLIKIKDEKEFTMAHQFFIKEGFLDG
jgi:hypothetical protein